MPEQISGNTALQALKEYLTQESFHLRGSERQRYPPPLLRFQGTETTGSWSSGQHCAKGKLGVFPPTFKSPSPS